MQSPGSGLEYWRRKGLVVLGVYVRAADCVGFRGARHGFLPWFQGISRPFIPTGLFIYSWTAEPRVHWAVPMLGMLLVCFGFTVVLASIENYLIDVFAASAMAALAVSRSVLAATFPLFALHLYVRLGWGWDNGLLGLVALAGYVIPPLFYLYGERLRTNPRFLVKS